MSKSHALLKAFRNLHLYIGIFISPAVLFFAFTGALQTFSLHETTKGSDYKPAAWIVTLGQLHKHQTTEVPQRKPTADKPVATDVASPGKAKADKPVDTPGAAMPDAAKPVVAVSAPVAPKRKSHLPMKIFFLLVAVSLCISTLTGVYMAYRFNRSRLVVTGLLVAGVLVPLLLLPF